MKAIFVILIILGTISVSCTKDKIDPNNNTSYFLKLNGAWGANDYSAINTSDNNIAICGSFEDSDGNSNSIVKLSENGEIIWMKQSGYSANSLVQNKNGNFFLCGKVRINPNDVTPEYNTVLIKTNSSGDTLWTKLFDYDISNIGENILETKDGNILIAGNTIVFGGGPGNGVLLSKTDYNGNLIWRRLYEDPEMFSLYHIVETRKGDFFITGTSIDDTKYGIYLTKLNANGDKLWGKDIKSDTLKIGHCAIELHNNQLMVCGNIKTNDSTLKVYMLKIDSDGNTIWEKEYGDNGTGSSGVSMKQNTDGSIVITGRSHNGTYGLMLIKIDEDGNQILFNQYPSQYYENASNIINNISKGYIITGSRVLGETEGSYSFITKVFE